MHLMGINLLWDKQCCIEKHIQYDDDLTVSFPVLERFSLSPDAGVVYKDATGTEVDADIFSDLIGQGCVVLTVISNEGEV